MTIGGRDIKLKTVNKSNLCQFHYSIIGRFGKWILLKINNNKCKQLFAIRPSSDWSSAQFIDIDLVDIYKSINLIDRNDNMKWKNGLSVDTNRQLLSMVRK